MKPIRFKHREQGKKLEPQIVQPPMAYHESLGFSTDKQIEFIFVQHKLMNEFLSKRNLVDAYNEFQNKEFPLNRECKDWMTKWDISHKDLSKYIKRW